MVAICVLSKKLSTALMSYEKADPARFRRGSALFLWGYLTAPFLVTRRRFELRTHCLKGKALILRAGGEPKTCCCSSTFRSSVFCVYVTRPTAYPVFYYNRKNGIRQTFLSINRHLILEINYSKAIFNRDDKMFRKTLLPDTNIFLTTAEVPLCGTQGRRHPALFYEAFASFFLCPSQITSHPNTTDSQKSII